MNVRVVASTVPDEALASEDIKDIQELVAFCARVSNPSNQYNSETSEKLINYLIKHKHFSPFEMANMVLEIETTRDIARQLLRHHSFTFQEFSQRYADPTKDLAFEIREARLQDQKNRQNSIAIDYTNEDQLELAKIWEDMQRDLISKVNEMYRWAVTNGIAKEQARAVLPEGLTRSRLYVNGTLRSWIHYIDVRSEEGTQLEHRDLARACAEVISKKFSMINNFNHYKK